MNTSRKPESDNIRVFNKQPNSLILTLSYTEGGGWIPPLLTLVLNNVSGIQAIVLMFGDFFGDNFQPVKIPVHFVLNFLEILVKFKIFT